MSPKVQDDLSKRFARSNEPEVEQRQIQLLDCLLSQFPEKKSQLVNEGVKKGERKGSRTEARKALSTLERWLEQAITATSVAEVFT